MVIAIVNGTSLKQWSYLDYLMFRNGSKIQSKITLCAMINFAFAWKKLPTNNFFRVSTVKWINSKDFQSIAKRKTIPRGSGYDATTSSNFMIWSFELHIYFSLPEPSIKVSFFKIFLASLVVLESYFIDSFLF